MDKNPEKPKFGVLEQIKALFSDKVRKPPLKMFLKNPKRAIDMTRTEIGYVLLDKRLPARNQDGSVNWANFFAASMQIASPIKRSDVFPDGTDSMTDDEIFTKINRYVMARSAKWNPGSVATAYDPVEFPEVIGPSLMRDILSKINNLTFARSIDSFTGNPRAGYGGSSSRIVIDWKNPESKDFFSELQALCKKFKNGKVNPILIGEPADDFGQIKLNLRIDKPDDWKENELPPDVLTPDQYEAKMIPGYIKEDGSEDLESYKKAFNDDEFVDKWEKYVIEYQKRKNLYGVSEQCRKIYEDFWNEVGNIAEKYKK